MFKDSRIFVINFQSKIEANLCSPVKNFVRIIDDVKSSSK